MLPINENFDLPSGLTSKKDPVVLEASLGFITFI
jgi:hypothetical protein